MDQAAGGGVVVTILTSEGSLVRTQLCPRREGPGQDADLRLTGWISRSSDRQMRLSCRFRGQILDHRPGRAGRRPPSASMASPMRAAGLWNPKAIRVMTLILVFTDSIRPLLSPWSRVAWIRSEEHTSEL